MFDASQPQVVYITIEWMQLQGCGYIYENSNGLKYKVNFYSIFKFLFILQENDSINAKSILSLTSMNFETSPVTETGM